MTRLTEYTPFKPGMRLRPSQGGNYHKATPRPENPYGAQSSIWHEKKKICKCGYILCACPDITQNTEPTAPRYDSSKNKDFREILDSAERAAKILFEEGHFIYISVGIEVRPSTDTLVVGATGHDAEKYKYRDSVAHLLTVKEDLRWQVIMQKLLRMKYLRQHEGQSS